MIHDLLNDTPRPASSQTSASSVREPPASPSPSSSPAQGKSVCSSEGGGASVEDSSQEPSTTAKSSACSHRGIHTGRIRVKGGTTVRWGGQILELDAHDFEPTAGIPDSGWPFPKTELTPFYERALHLEGLANVQRSDDAVWRDLDLPLTTFDDLEPYLSRWCPEPNFARLHNKIPQPRIPTSTCGCTPTPSSSSSKARPCAASAAEP